MTAIHVPGLLTFTIAILVFFAGAGLNRLIGPLRRWNFPEPVTGVFGGAATLIGYVLRARDHFDSTRATCYSLPLDLLGLHASWAT